MQNSFANDSVLFAVVKDKNKSVNALNNDLSLISQWDFNWKMIFSQTCSRSFIFKEKESIDSSCHKF